MKPNFRNLLIIHPLLFAVFPVIFFYNHNLNEISSTSLIEPLIILVASSVTLWIILTFFMKSKTKGALATTFCLSFFYFYGHIHSFLENQHIILSHRHLLPGSLLLLGYIIYFIKISRRTFVDTTFILNIISVFLVSINLFSAVSKSLRTILVQPHKNVNTLSTPVEAKDHYLLPDIYYIVLDEYSSPDTMRRCFGYENSSFLNALKQKGFFISQHSRTRTPHTPQAIAQVVNMEYLTPGWYWDAAQKAYIEKPRIGDKYPKDHPWSEATYRRYACNKVAQFLKSRGYKYIYFGNYMDVGRWDKYMKSCADQYYNYYQSSKDSWISEFGEVFWNTTMLKPFYQHYFGRQFESYYRRGVLKTIEHIKHIPLTRLHPCFVFAHIVCPHPPFVFGPHGEFVPPSEWKNFKDKRFYLGQYIFISNKMLDVVKTVLEDSPVDPIIIIQSDHGIRPQYPDIEIEENEWTKIFNAYYCSNGTKTFYDGVSPVNTFRIIFNHHFKSQLELLPD